MIRQAHTYLAGAVSGTALVGAAIVAFVLLVSFQALRDWPLADLSLGGDDVARSPGLASGQASEAPIGPAGATSGAQVERAAGAGAAEPRRRPAEGGAAETAVNPTQAPSATAPGGESPAPSPAGQGAPSSSSPSGASSSAQTGSGGGSNPGAAPSGTAGGGGGQSTSEAIGGTVNNTVSGVDQATGGALGSTGVTKVTEEVVGGTVGPESVVGKTVDETVKTVGGLLGK